MSNKIYQPKGGMCANCAHKHRDCSRLKFSEMPKLNEVNGAVIVRCTEYKRDGWEGF